MAAAAARGAASGGARARREPRLRRPSEQHAAPPPPARGLSRDFSQGFRRELRAKKTARRKEPRAPKPARPLLRVRLRPRRALTHAQNTTTRRSRPVRERTPHACRLRACALLRSRRGWIFPPQNGEARARASLLVRCWSGGGRGAVGGRARGPARRRAAVFQLSRLCGENNNAGSSVADI